MKGSEEDGDEKEVSTESYEDQDKLRPQMHANAARSDTRTRTRATFRIATLKRARAKQEKEGGGSLSLAQGPWKGPIVARKAGFHSQNYGQNAAETRANMLMVRVAKHEKSTGAP